MRSEKMKRWFPALSSFALLVVLTWGTWWVVQTQRPPGAMTPLEAQGMDMSVMRPPRGAFPVGVERVQLKPFMATPCSPPSGATADRLNSLRHSPNRPHRNMEGMDIEYATFKQQRFSAVLIRG